MFGNWFAKRRVAAPIRRAAHAPKVKPRFDLLEDRATPAVTSLVSTALPTDEGAGSSILTTSRGASFSSEGRYFVFSSEADNLVAGDTNGASDIFVADLTNGSIRLVSAKADGTPGNLPSLDPSISADGRFVAFMSYANDLVAGDANGTADVFVKDLDTGAISLVSASAAGVVSNNFSFDPAISANGQYVAFASYSSNLHADDDPDFIVDVFRKNLTTGQVDLVSRDSSNVKGNDDSVQPALSADGRYVVFTTRADNFISGGDPNGTAYDLYRKDLSTGALVLVSATAAAASTEGGSLLASLSADGNLVAFESDATDLVAGDVNAFRDVFVKNLTTGAVTLVSVLPDGTQGDFDSFGVSLASDGSKATFVTQGTAFAAGDENAALDLFVRDLATGAVTHASRTPAGAFARFGVGAGVMSPNGARVGFWSFSDDFSAGDNNGLADVFVQTLGSDATTLVSRGTLTTIGGTGDSATTPGQPAVGGDGRYVAFVSTAVNLVAGSDANGSTADVFLRDLDTGAVTRLSQTAAGVQANGPSLAVSIDASGQIAAFASTATNLAEDDANGFSDIFVRTANGALTLVSRAGDGTVGNGPSSDPVVSGNGRYVAFVTQATNLFTDATATFSDIVVLDRQMGTMTLASVRADGVQGSGHASDPVISDDGRYVAFVSTANSWVAGDTNGRADIFLKDLVTGALTLVSKNLSGTVGDGDSAAPSISGDGRFVAFASAAKNLVTGDTNAAADIFVVDRTAGAVIRASVSAAGAQGNALSQAPSLSRDGRFVAFDSFASNLVDVDGNAARDVFVRDLQTGAVLLVSASSAGAQGDGASSSASIDPSGRFVAYASEATTLAAADVNVRDDVFLTSLDAAPTIALPATFTIAEGQSLALDASGTTDPDGGTLAFAWDLNADGDFGDASGAAPTLTWAQLQALGIGDDGAFPVSVRVTDAFGPVTRTTTVTVTNAAPTPSIGLDAVGTLEGQTASFSASATDPSLPDQTAGFTFSWTATRNGVPIASGEGAAFTFALVDEGAYQVVLTAQDADGANGQTTYDFNVGNVAPTLDLTGAPTSGAEGTEVTFVASASDPGTTDMLTYAWTVTRGGSTVASGTSASIAFTPADDGAYLVEVSLSDGEGGSDVESFTVTVADVAPTLTLTGADTSPEGSVYTLSVSASDPGTDTITGWSVQWGDGTTDNFLAAQTTFTHTYADGAAPASVVVTATNEDGQFSAGKAITVTDVAPTLAIAGAATVAPGATYSVTVGAVFDPGQDTPTGYRIVWGDGASDAVAGTPNGLSFTHVYASEGAFVVRVFVTNEDGEHEAGNRPVTVAVAPDTPPTAELTGNASVVEGQSYTLGVSVADTDGVQVTSYVVRWGDGQTTNAAGVPPATLTHVYADNGAYTIAIDLVDPHGTHEGIGSKGVVVTNVAPSIALTGADAVVEGNSYTLNLGAVVDPGTDTIASWSVLWGDGQTSTGTGEPPATLTHTYVNGQASRSIVMTLVDEDGSHAGAGTKTISVTNAAPVITLAQTEVTLTEGDVLSVGGSFTDLGVNDVWSATADFGAGPQNLTLVGKTFVLNRAYPVDGEFTVVVRVSDTDGGQGEATLLVHVANATPVVSAGANASLGTAGTLSRNGSFTDPGADTWTATVDYGDGAGPQALTLVGKTFALSHTYATPGTYTVTVRVSDGLTTGSTSFTVTRDETPNVVPTVDAGDDATAAEGNLFTRSGSFVDSDTDTWTATVDYGDGAGAVPLTLTGKTFSLAHTYADDGTYTVRVTIDDGRGGAASDLFDVVVSNTTPVVSVGPDASLLVGATLTRSGSFSDPGADAWAATVDYGDGAGQQPLTLSGKAFSLSHTYASAGTFLVTVRVNDGDGGVGSGVFEVAVTPPNAVPTLDIGSGETLAEGDTFGRSASFVDSDADTWSGTVDFGEGDGPVPLVLDNKSFTLSHVYASDGVYTVTVSIDDGAGGIASDSLVVTVENVAPVVSAGGGTSLRAGQTFSRTGSFVDPGADLWTATIDYGDGSGVQPLALVGNTFAMSHVYASVGDFTATVRVNDGDEVGVSTFVVAVAAAQAFEGQVTLSSNSIAENSTAGAVVGTVETDDFVVNATAAFSLVNDAGGRFRLSGRTLEASGTGLDFETATSHVVRVRVTPSAGSGLLPKEVDFTIQVTNVREGTDVPTGQEPRADLVGRDPVTGAWFVADSTGSSFNTAAADGVFDPAKTWVDFLAADVDGDGLVDLLARELATGRWQLAKNAGGTFATSTWDQWASGDVWADLRAVDLDRDGKTDLLGRHAPTGDWWASFSNGTNGTPAKVGNWSTSNRYADVQIADLDGDTRPDLVGRVDGSNVLIAALNKAGSPRPTLETVGTWGQLPRTLVYTRVTPDVWLDMKAADVNGDGKADVLARLQRNGSWYVCLSQGAMAGEGAAWATWSTRVSWGQSAIADVNGDGKQDLVGRNETTGVWEVRTSDGASFVPRTVTASDPAQATDAGESYANVVAADFNGDGKTDVAFRKADGKLMVGVSLGDLFSFDVWDTWPTNPARTTWRTGKFR